MWLTNLITVQQDATYSINYISVAALHVSGVNTQPPGARTTVITASGID